MILKIFFSKNNLLLNKLLVKYLIILCLLFLSFNKITSLSMATLGTLIANSNF